MKIQEIRRKKRLLCFHETGGFSLFLGRFRNDNRLALSNLLFSTGDHDAWSIDGSESEIKDPAF